MKLHFCGCCGQSIDSPDHSMTVVSVPIDAGALAEWQADVTRECQHVPACLGPWQHAVKVVREAWDCGTEDKAKRTAAC